MVLIGHPPRVRIGLLDQPPVSGHRPSIDVLFQSAARAYQSAAIGLLMTGMGRDGVEGCKAILAARGFTLGQDEGTSVVYGMNKAAFLEGAVKAQLRSTSSLTSSKTSSLFARARTLTTLGLTSSRALLRVLLLPR